MCGGCSGCCVVGCLPPFCRRGKCCPVPDTCIYPPSVIFSKRAVNTPVRYTCGMGCCCDTPAPVCCFAESCCSPCCCPSFDSCCMSSSCCSCPTDVRCDRSSRCNGPLGRPFCTQLNGPPMMPPFRSHCSSCC